MRSRLHRLVNLFWICVILALVIAFLPNISRCMFSGKEEFKIERVSKVEGGTSVAFSLSFMTQTFSKCPYYAGILRGHDPIDLKDYLGNNVEYSPEVSCVLWCYGLKPYRVERAGRSTKVLVGKGETNLIYLAVLPKSLGRKETCLKMEIAE